MSDTENQQPQTPKAARAPKLAPAPVPQETPWKAPALDGTTAKPNFEAVEATKSAKKQASAGDAKDAGSKRSTTGKEKWVPYAPVVPIPSGSSSSSGSSGSARSRQKRQQNNSGGAYRSRRGQNDRGSNGNGQSNGNSEKRKSGNLSNPSARGAGHQRSQSKAGKLADPAAPSGAPRAASADASASPLGNGAATDGQANGTKSVPNTNGSAAASAEIPVAGVDALHVSGDHPRGDRPQKQAGHHNKSNYTARPNSAGKKPKDSRYGPHKSHYHQGGYIPNGMPYPMIPVPMAPQDYVYPAEYVFGALVNQINHYFSMDNLCRDLFLRKNMNDEGLVPIAVISGFNRVKSMTTDANTIYQACQSAPNLIVIGDKVRAAQNWERWLVPENQRLPAGLDKGSGPEPPAASQTPKEPKFQVQQAVPFTPKGN